MVIKDNDNESFKTYMYIRLRALRFLGPSLSPKYIFFNAFKTVFKKLNDIIG